MSSIQLSGLTKSFGAFQAVKTLDLEIANGEFVAILGPSGCGKTTTMNMIAGIESPTGGVVKFDDQDVTSFSIQRRNVGFVFQNYAIFTHMSVRDNLAFGLKVRGLAQGEITRKVEAMAEFMALTPRLNHPSSALSVNELQKLAIGRSAIVEPKIFLLDEPLSNLDAAFREKMRQDLRELQRNLKQTMVYVTHDQIEAMGLADRIAVMSQGELQQYDTPARIYAEPVNVFVANFIGAPSMNILPAKVEDTGGKLSLRFGQEGGFSIPLIQTLEQKIRASGLTSVLFGFRPEAVHLAKNTASASLSATASLVETVGWRRIAHLKAGDANVTAVLDRNAGVKNGQVVHLTIDQQACHIFNPANEMRLL